MRKSRDSPRPLEKTKIEVPDETQPELPDGSSFDLPGGHAGVRQKEFLERRFPGGVPLSEGAGEQVPPPEQEAKEPEKKDVPKRRERKRKRQTSK